MPRARQANADLRVLVETFTNQLIGAVESTINERIQLAVTAALEGVGSGRRRPGRPPKNGLVRITGLAFAPLKRREKQLCPVPSCTNPAAPVFGMVCSDHKDVPKPKIKEYRDARRRAKLEGGKRAAKEPRDHKEARN